MVFFLRLGRKIKSTIKERGEGKTLQGEETSMEPTIPKEDFDSYFSKVIESPSLDARAISRFVDELYTTEYAKRGKTTGPFSSEVEIEYMIHFSLVYFLRAMARRAFKNRNRAAVILAMNSLTEIYASGLFLANFTELWNARRHEEKRFRVDLAAKMVEQDLEIYRSKGQRMVPGRASGTQDVATFKSIAPPPTEVDAAFQQTIFSTTDVTDEGASLSGIHILLLGITRAFVVVGGMDSILTTGVQSSYDVSTGARNTSLQSILYYDIARSIVDFMFMACCSALVKLSRTHRYSMVQVAPVSEGVSLEHESSAWMGSSLLFHTAPIDPTYYKIVGSISRTIYLQTAHYILLGNVPSEYKDTRVVQSRKERFLEILFAMVHYLMPTETLAKAEKTRLMRALFAQPSPEALSIVETALGNLFFPMGEESSYQSVLTLLFSDDRRMEEAARQASTTRLEISLDIISSILEQPIDLEANQVTAWITESEEVPLVNLLDTAPGNEITSLTPTEATFVSTELAEYTIVAEDSLRGDESVFLEPEGFPAEPLLPPPEPAKIPEPSLPESEKEERVRIKQMALRLLREVGASERELREIEDEDFLTLSSSDMASIRTLTSELQQLQKTSQDQLVEIDQLRTKNKEEERRANELSARLTEMAETLDRANRRLEDEKTSLAQSIQNLARVNEENRALRERTEALTSELETARQEYEDVLAQGGMGTKTSEQITRLTKELREYVQKEEALSERVAQLQQEFDDCLVRKENSEKLVRTIVSSQKQLQFLKKWLQVVASTEQSTKLRNILKRSEWGAVETLLKQDVSVGELTSDRYLTTTPIDPSAAPAAFNQVERVRSTYTIRKEMKPARERRRRRGRGAAQEISSRVFSRKKEEKAALPSARNPSRSDSTPSSKRKIDQTEPVHSVAPPRATPSMKRALSQASLSDDNKEEERKKENPLERTTISGKVVTVRLNEPSSFPAIGSTVRRNPRESFYREVLEENPSNGYRDARPSEEVVMQHSSTGSLFESSPFTKYHTGEDMDDPWASSPLAGDEYGFGYEDMGGWDHVALEHSYAPRSMRHYEFPFAMSRPSISSTGFGKKTLAVKKQQKNALITLVAGCLTIASTGIYQGRCWTKSGQKRRKDVFSRGQRSAGKKTEKAKNALQNISSGTTFDSSCRTANRTAEYTIPATLDMIMYEWTKMLSLYEGFPIQYFAEEIRSLVSDLAKSVEKGDRRRSSEITGKLCTIAGFSEGLRVSVINMVLQMHDAIQKFECKQDRKEMVGCVLQASKLNV